MSLLWPGDERAGDLMSEYSLLKAMVEVEQAWIGSLHDAGASPSYPDLSGLVEPSDLRRLAASAESGGNVVTGLVGLLRERLQSAGASRWLHRGLTSQDVVDTALMLCLRATCTQIRHELTSHVHRLVDLAEEHRDAVMVGRTLTQHAVPITFGLKAANWLTSILDARDAIEALRFPIQIGGAAGTLAATTQVIGSAEQAVAASRRTAERLTLEESPPWHTSRRPFTAIADAFVTVTDACGRIANDVLTLARPEIAELAEPAGRGGSSTMPQKANPVLSVLIKRAALAAPLSGAQVHLAAAAADDERPDGAWHTEWETLATLGRRTVVAASQTTDLLYGLHVDTGRMATRVGEASSGLLAEQHSIAELTGAEPGLSAAGYLGAHSLLIDTILDRAKQETT